MIVTVPPTVPSLTDRRLLVVGASSGIGRALAEAAARAGAQVAIAARRFDALQEVAAGIGDAAYPVQCDVRVPVAVDLAVRAAVTHLEGLDAVVYATGINRLMMLTDTDAATWRELFDTNVVGAALVTRAALPALRSSAGRIAFLSSDSVAHPFPGLGAYAASKAALETYVCALRGEAPGVEVARVVVGPTVTGMADDWDPDLAAEMFERWAALGLFSRQPMPPEWVAEHLVAWLADPAPPDDLDLYARTPLLETGDPPEPR